MLTQTLHEDGLLKRTDGFPLWTKEHPETKRHGKRSKNITDKIQRAQSAEGASRLGHIAEWIPEGTLKLPDTLRNQLLHGILLDVSEHEASTLIFLLQAIHHGIDPNVS